MALFTIGDLHLSLSTDKPMDIFGGWDNYVEKLKENWNNVVSEKDTVVLPGDISWAMSLEKAYTDFRFINDELKGKKIIIKGNHDYWWNTAQKMRNFLNRNNLDNLNILSNNAFFADGVSITGTRGWINEAEEPDVKILSREAGRLEMSVREGEKLGGELIAFIHYPPIYGNEENYYIIDVLQKYGIKRCYYGHLHGMSCKRAFSGMRYGCEFTLVSADNLGFAPYKIK